MSKPSGLQQPAVGTQMSRAGEMKPSLGTDLTKLVGSVAQPFVDAASLSAAYAEAFSGRVYNTRAEGEAGTGSGLIFRVNNGDGTLAPFLRTGDGSTELNPLATSDALASGDRGKGASLVRTENGASVQDWIAVAATPSALLATIKAFPPGARVRTADGFSYVVAESEATHHHLQTAGGVKLYVEPDATGFHHVRAWGADGTGSVDAHLQIQAALNTGLDLEFGGRFHTYLIGAPLKQQSGQKLRGKLATLRASKKIAAILIRASDTEVEGLKFDCNNEQPTAPSPKITWVGAQIGMDFKNIDHTSSYNCHMTRYINGIRILSDAHGVSCSDHEFINCKAIAGYDWEGYRADNIQLAAYVGSSVDPATTIIETFDAVRRGAEDVFDIRFINWQAYEGQYGLALHRCSNVQVIGGSFRRMSRAISIQHQSEGVTVTGAHFLDLDSTCVHIAYGSRQVTISGCRFRGTSANDNEAVQGYYGVQDITVQGCQFDSTFDRWEGGNVQDIRAPDAAMRFGQQAEGITILGNKVRGYKCGVLLRTSIYAERITPSDPNYYKSGIRNVTIRDNDFRGSYFTTTTGYKKSLLLEQSSGIRIQISGAWEDKNRGAWDIETIVIDGNNVENMALGYVVESVSMLRGASAPTVKEFGVRLHNNRTQLIKISQVVRSTIGNPLSVTYEGNSWPDEQDWAPEINSTLGVASNLYSLRVGKWVARGRRVIVHGRIVLADKDMVMGGNPVITGIPGRVLNSANLNRAGGVSLFGDWTLAAGYTNLGIFAAPNSSHLRIIRTGSGQNAAYPNYSEVGVAAQIDFHCEYEVA